MSFSLAPKQCRASHYFGRLSTNTSETGTVSCVALISYEFLQIPALACDTLAIKITFPLVGVIKHLSTNRVCQRRWAKKKP